jgi:imidazolonepropionase-like amidohydrolase
MERKVGEMREIHDRWLWCSFRFGLAVFMIGCVLTFSAPVYTQEASSELVFKNVRVFDGHDVFPAHIVIVREGRIVGFGIDLEVPPGAEVIDGAGLTLLPGFFDAHVHVMGEQSLKQALVFGITTVVDMFMDIKTMNSIKQRQVSGGTTDLAYLISPGILATAPGGHGTQYGLPIPTLSKPEDAVPFVEARIAEGSDFIKIILDDGSAYGMSRPTLDPATVSAVIDAAHRNERLAVIHAATLDQCKQAIEAGVDGLAHLFFNRASDPEFGRLAAAKNTFVIPTLSVLEAMSGISEAHVLADVPTMADYLKPDDIQSLKMTFPFTTSKAAYSAAEKALRQLREQKVRILAGTDAPNPGTTFGASLHRELELLVRAGLTPQEALRSATSIPARIFGLAERGCIRPGFKADLVLVQGNPTHDITDTRRILGVWKGGVKVDRDRYRMDVEKAIAARERQKNAPPPENSESGLISDFEGDAIASEYGAGWSLSTDAMIGGKSEAEYVWIEGGARKSRGCLLITGRVAEGAVNRWAGAMFSPGPSMMSPANLSHKTSLSLWAKGDGKTYTVMIFAQSLGFIPGMVSFTAGPEWKEYIFPYEKFGVEGYDIMGIFVGSSAETGAFSLKIDDVRLK